MPLRCANVYFCFKSTPSAFVTVALDNTKPFSEYLSVYFEVPLLEGTCLNATALS